VSNYLNLGPFPRRRDTTHPLAPLCRALSSHAPPPVVSDVLACGVPPPPGVVARTPSLRHPLSRRCTLHPCTRLHASSNRARSRLGQGQGGVPEEPCDVTVHRNTFAVLRCTRNIARCTRTRNRMGTVFSGTGRGVTRGTRGLPVSRPDNYGQQYHLGKCQIRTASPESSIHC
jgi:hypothetical protein